MSYTKLEPHDIAVISNVLKRAKPLLDELDSKLPSSGPGRNVSAVMLIAGMLATAIHDQSVHLSDAVDHLNRLTPTDRRALGLGDFHLVTYRAFQHTFELFTRLIDPYHRRKQTKSTNIEEDAAAEAADKAARVAAARLSEDLLDAMITATIPVQFVNHPHLAIDTTHVQSWKTPPNYFGAEALKKRAEAAADERKALAARASAKSADETTTEIVDAALRVAKGHVDDRSPIDRGDPRGKRLTGYTDEDYDGTPAANLPYPDYPIQKSPYDSSACWIGHHNPSKRVYGHGLQLCVGIPARGANPDSRPLFAVAARVTKTTENPPAAMLSMLVERQRRHEATGAKGPATGDLAADNAFFPSALPALSVKALGADPNFHLHSTNQQGSHHHDEKRCITWIDGRPYCSCMPKRLWKLVYPRFPHQQKERAAYRLQIEERKQYEYRTKGAPKADGSRRFKSPHNKKCVRCNTSSTPCCKAGSLSFSADELALYQHEIFGSAEWAESFGRRALVEGYFGVLKTVSGLRGDNARFHNHGKVALAYTLLICATNLRLVETWRKRCALKASKPDQPTRRERRRRKSLEDYSPIAEQKPDPELDARARKPPGPLDFLNDR